MAKIQIKRGLQSAVENLVLSEGELAVALDTGNVYIGTTAGKVHINPKGGNADTASKLSTPRSFSISGDATAPAVSFDGSENVQMVLTLADIVNLKSGTYAKVTVDSKGRVTTGATLEVADIPNIPTSKITGLGTAATKNVGTSSDNIVSVQTDGKILSSLLPDLSGTYVPVGTKINGKPLTNDITLTAKDVSAVPSADKGVAGGVATLDETGKVTSSQLPSYVDDVSEYNDKSAFPKAGESGIIYIAKDTNLTYRWSGTEYVEISPSLALGTTASTAYPGDKGKTAYDHSQKTSGNPHKVTAAEVGAAPSGHTAAIASASALGHIKLGAGLSVTSDGKLSIDAIDGGTF